MTQQTMAKATVPAENGTLLRRIGSTTYRVNVYFSQTSEETMGDKIKRLVKNEVKGKTVTQ